MRIYNVAYDPKNNKGIYALSVVNSPAMESQWITLNKNQSIKLATIDNERRILMGIALIPNKPIYRNDKGNEYNIVFSSKTIAQAAHDFVRNGNTNNSTLEHEIDLGSDAVSVVESWIIEDDIHDKSRKFGFNEPVGSWAVMMKVHDDATWQKAKNGEIKGFSIDGVFDLKEISKKVNMNKTEKKNVFQKLGEALIKAGTPNKVELASVKTADGLDVMHDGESLEAGASVYIENDGEQVPLPVGEYSLEDGKTLVVTEEGIASEIKEAKAQDDDVEMSEDELKTFFEALDKAFGLSEIKEQLTALKTENEALKVQLSEIGKQPATTKAPAKAVTLTQTTQAKTSQGRLYELLKN